MITVGIATRVINPALGSWVQGATQALKATEIRDNLEANAVFLSDGKTPLLLVNCDLAGLESDFVAEVRETMSTVARIPPRQILISCTHTHSGPSVIRTNYLMPLDRDYHLRLKGWLVDLAREAVASAEPGCVGWARGEAAIGYNRRCCWADGTHTMHGDTSRSDFTGLEGPDDHQHLTLFVMDPSRKIRAVIYNNTSHPTHFFSCGIYSADFPGVVRARLREKFGSIPVLFLNGAFGDISAQNMMETHAPKITKEDAINEWASRAYNETMRLSGLAEVQENPVLGHAVEDLRIPVRLPDEEVLEESRDVLARVDAGEEVKPFDRLFAFGTVHLQERFGDYPVDTVPVHAVRIGDVALATQPCELYCQFGLDIKRRSPAPLTGVAGITDGYGGYCPTLYGIMSGGYSGRAIAWCRLEPEAGYKIVDTAARLVNGLWKNKK